MSIYDLNIRGAVDVTWTALDEDPARVLVTPGVSAVTRNPNIELSDIQALEYGSKGVLRTVSTRTISENLQYTFTLPAVTPEIFSIVAGRALETTSSVERYLSRSNFLIEANEYPAKAAGELGYAVAADAVSQASYLNGELSAALTQVNFATLDPAVDTLSFAVGANGALKFTNDLIGKSVGYRIPATYTNVTTLGENAFKKFSVDILMIQDDYKMFNIHLPEVDVRRDAGDVTFGQEVQVTVSALTAGRCVSELITYLGESDSCAEPVTS